MINKWKMKYYRLLNKNEDDVLKNVKKIERKGPLKLEKNYNFMKLFINN